MLSWLVECLRLHIKLFFFKMVCFHLFKYIRIKDMNSIVLIYLEQPTKLEIIIWQG